MKVSKIDHNATFSGSSFFKEVALFGFVDAVVAIVAD
jgi:hypothetical protein